MAHIRVNNLTKFFGLSQALYQVAFQAESGETLALMGGNGAGKSTLLRCLAGVLRPDQGKVEIDGISLFHKGSTKEHITRLEKLGVILERSLVYNELSVQGNLELYASLYQIPDPRGVALSLIEKVGLSDARTVLARNLSQGMTKRLAIARAILHQPKLLLFDEPFANLDLSGREMLSNILKELRDAGATLIMALHEPELVRLHAERVLILNQGILVKDVRVEEFSEEQLLRKAGQP